MAIDLAQIIPPLVKARVDFILIGGMAAILDGSARVTVDVDFVYSRTDQNIGPKDREAVAELRVLLEESEKKEAQAPAGFLSRVSLLTSALVAFSKSIPHALSRARVGIAIRRNIQIGTSRMRTPSQMT